jgi:hypothetical protein
LRIPSTLAKGDSFTWKDDPTVDNLGNALDSSGYTLKYAIRGAVSLNLTASTDGPGWQTAISTTQSGTLTAGTYFWQAYVVDNPVSPTKRITIGSGQLKITDDVTAASTGYDGRSQIQKDLEAVQSAMRAIISGGAVQNYMIGGRSVQKMQMGDLITLESKLKYELKREQKADLIKNGLGNPHNLFVRFK